MNSIRAFGVVLAAAIPLAAHSPARCQRPEASLEARIRAMHRAEARCEWEQLAARSRELRGSLPVEDAGWLLAGAKLGGALHTSWTEHARAELIEVGRETLAMDDRWRLRLGEAHFDAPGGDGERIAFEMARLRALLADALHSDDLAVEALGHRRLAILDFGRLSTPHARLFQSQSQLAEAGDLLALGRPDEARNRLVALRDEHPRSGQSSVATALLSLPEDPLAGYRGDFVGDPRLGVRALELRRALPAARQRVASWIGEAAVSLDAVAVGIADPEDGQESWSAFQQYLPRSPALPPVVVVHAHELVLGRDEVEELLVHELSHAALNRELGVAFERSPNWVHEGLATSLAGQLERLTDTVLAIPLHQSPAAFLGANVLEGFRFPLDIGPCYSRAYVGDQLAAGLFLEEHCGGPGAPRLVQALLAGEEFPQALRSACGLDPGEAVGVARDLARSRLEERWREVVPAVREIERLALESPPIFLAMVEGGLAANGPELAREHALRRRAEILEAAGELVEAAAAWGQLFELNGPGADARRLAQVSQVRCLLPAADEDTTRELLARLQREALHHDIRTWARAKLSSPESLESSSDRR